MKQCLMMTAIGFFSGAVMYSYLIPRLFFKVDVRGTSEDGNPGSSNVISAVGLPVGLLCMALDVLKAFVPVFVSVTFLGVQGVYLISIVVAPVAGHAFSPFLRFKGGKAVSVTYGSLLGLLSISRFVFIVAIIMAFFRFIVVVRPDSAGVITSMTTASLFALFFAPVFWLKTAVILIAVIVAIKQLQRPNKGPFSVSIGHYAVVMEDNGLKFCKI